MLVVDRRNMVLEVVVKVCTVCMCVCVCVCACVCIVSACWLFNQYFVLYNVNSSLFIYLLTILYAHNCLFTICTFYSLVSPGMASHSSPLSPDEVTRVVYYLDKDETPYRTSIPKRSVIYNY